MTTTRRSFLKSGIIFTVLAKAPSVFGRVGDVSSKELMDPAFADAADFSRENFAKLVNTEFMVRLNNTTVALTLAEVNEALTTMKRGYRRPPGENFSLIFTGPYGNYRLDQETYLVKHKALGSFSLFLVPIGPRENHRYEAIINRKQSR
ncbi:MAG: hypothetical protein ABR555_18285 [Pyrinomonadaceae bacterium]